MGSLIYPAVDILEGKCSRLTEGDYTRRTVYYDDPADAAVRWEDAGAQWIHVVDLDGAKAGRVVNIAALKRMRRRVSARIQFGGGVRDKESIKSLIEEGVDRVIIGTRAISAADFLEDIAGAFGASVCVSVDAKDGLAAVQGWLALSQVKASRVIEDAVRAGIKTVIYTDIKSDGTLKGPNIEAVKEALKACPCGLIAAGGVTTALDVRALSVLSGLSGIIIGKALYEGTVDLKEAMECSQNV